MSDESFADLDCDVSLQEESAGPSIHITDDEETHIIGKPPSYGDSDSDDDYSGSSDYNLENATAYVEDDATRDLDARPEPLPRHLISNTPQPVNVPNEEELNKYIECFQKHFFVASLCSQPTHMRNGYSPEDIDKCIIDMMGFGLNAACTILLGSAVTSQFMNSSKLERCDTLKNAGWLVAAERQGYFQPVLPDSEKQFVEQMIDGAEHSKRMEAEKKKAAETFPSAEAEIKALRTYNMICELMAAVMAILQRNTLLYTDISNAFESMVTGREHSNLLMKYKRAGLVLDQEERWKGDWFKEYTNRSTLKKLVTMPKFSGIVCDVRKGTEFSFRNANSGMPVKLFTDDDIKEVNDRWNGENRQNNSRRDGNGRYQGRRDNSRPPGAQPARVREADPNYTAPVLSGGIDHVARASNEGTDNGERLRYASRSPPRRNRSPSPQRSRSPSPTMPTSRQTYNPFGGPSAAPIASNSTTARSSRYDPLPQSNHVARVDDDAYSSTENEVTSEGEYSDETEETKREREAERKKKKEKKLRKKAERDMRRANMPPQALQNSNNRFAVSSFPQPESMDSPVPPSRESLSPVADEPPRQQQPSPQQPQPQQRQYQQPMEAPGLAISESQFDEEQQQLNSVPYHSVESQVRLNRQREEEERRRAAEEEEQRQRDMQAAQQGGRVLNPMLQQRQREQQPPNVPLSEPPRGVGFGHRKRNDAPPSNTQQQPSQNYSGMNDSRPTGNDQFAPINNMPPAAQNQTQFYQNSGQTRGGQNQNEYQGMNNTQTMQAPHPVEQHHPHPLPYQGEPVYHQNDNNQRQPSPMQPYPMQYQDNNQGGFQSNRQNSQYPSAHSGFSQNAGNSAPIQQIFYPEVRNYSQGTHQSQYPQVQSSQGHGHQQSWGGNSANYQGHMPSMNASRGGPRTAYSPPLHPPQPQYHQRPDPPPSSLFNQSVSDFTNVSRVNERTDGHAPFDPLRAVPPKPLSSHLGVSPFGSAKTDQRKKEDMKAAFSVVSYLRSFDRPISEGELRSGLQNRHFFIPDGWDVKAFVDKEVHMVNKTQQQYPNGQYVWMYWVG